ncbi:MAG: MBOAT family protein, partial [Oscillospiraceae bacterium]|nr:MBOAT family protein [Oscillospiraceae bacterium]
MVFSSAIFLFAFLPIIFIAYRLVPGQKGKNWLLILFSLIFYSFGSLTYLPLLLFSVLCNYIAGLLVARPGRGRKAALVGAVIVNLTLLGTFKYLDFLIENINGILGTAIPLAGITLPIGISFFTFQGMSYVIDTYRNPDSGTKSFSKVLLYISLFPQLVAGPIVKYLDVSQQIDQRSCTPELTRQGIVRFIVGLSKKLLLANTLGLVADQVFSLTAAQLDVRSAWLGAVCYTLQIYFDFSGYSDMAIGLGKMFGFSFYENFRHPYCSASVTEFWRRWHISLSSWFREYLYIPLGGNRKGTARTRLNLLIVFFCTGLWHGASWTFVLWGLWHGAFRLLESITGLDKKHLPVIGRLYT